MSDDASRASEPRGRRKGQPDQQRSNSSWFSRDHLETDGQFADGQFANEADVGVSPDHARGGTPHEAPMRDNATSSSLSGSGSVPPVGGPTGGTRPTDTTGSGAVVTTGETPRRSTEQRYADAVNAMTRVIDTQDPSALPWIIEVFRTTAGMLATDDPARASVLNNLGTAAQLTFVTSVDLADLEDAIGYYRAAVGAAGNTDEDLILYRSNLVLAWTDYALRTRDSATSGQAVEHARETVQNTPSNDHRQHMTLVRLANALRAHTRLSGDPTADEESIDVFRAAVRTAPDGATGELLVNLGAALTRRHERSGAAEPLDESVRHLATGANALPEGTSRHRALCYYAVALRSRFHATGDLTDLSTATTELLTVVSSAPDGHPLRGRAAQRLAECAIDYIDATGEPQPLRHVLRPIAEALHAMRGTDSYRGPVLARYGALLRRHYQQHAEEAALNTAVTVGEEAVRQVSEQQRDAAIVSLTRTLLTRYEHNGDRADLDRAVDVATALTTQPAGATPVEHIADASPNGQQATSTQITAALHTALLGALAAQGARHSEQPTDLDAAVQRLAQGLGGIPDTLPARVDVTLHLGRALRRPAQRSGKRRNYRWARKVLGEAAGQPTAPADQRLRAAEMAGRLAAQAERWGDAAASLHTAVELLPLVPRGKRVVAAPAVQQHWASLTADAAACMIESGESQRAVELIEHGRSAVLTDYLPSGGELGELHRIHPELADQAVRLRRLLDRPTAEPALAPIDDRAQLARAWDGLLEQIRTADPNHLRPTSFQELAGAARYGAEHGTLVLLNVSRYRSDALIIFGEHVVTVPLPGATPETVAERAQAALEAALNRDEQALHACLRWTWDHLVRPVLDRMGYMHTPEAGQRWPRVWWCAQGAAAYLPLHAATSADGTSALERVVSSYTPTVRTLLRARNRRRVDPPSQLLAAGSTEHVSRELPYRNQVVARHWPHADVTSTETASAADMLDQLPRYSWLHVCERSVAYPAQPAAASVLAREAAPSLGVVEIGQVPLHGAELCTLARCATAAQEPSPAAVTLPSALGFAGYAHVLGSLWETDEHSIGVALDGVYTEIVDGEADHTGYALHDAARRLRAQFPDEPTRWAGFLHVGP